MTLSLEKEIERLELEALCFRLYLERNHSSTIEPTPQVTTANAQPVKPLLLNQKLEIATSLLGDIQHDTAESKRLHQQKVDTINISLEEIELRLVDLEKDAFAFKRDVVVKVDNEAPNKANVERLLRYYQSRILSLESTLDRLYLQQSDQKRTLNKLLVQLKQRESVGSSFHFLDFHQLQIDTKKQVQQLTEKTNELARVKMQESKQHGKLTVMKGQLAEIEKETQAADKAIALRQKHKVQLDDTIVTATIEIEKIKQHAEQTKGGSGDDPINVMGMVK